MTVYKYYYHRFNQWDNPISNVAKNILNQTTVDVCSSLLGRNHPKVFLQTVHQNYHTMRGNEYNRVLNIHKEIAIDEIHPLEKLFIYLKCVHSTTIFIFHSSLCTTIYGIFGVLYRILIPKF
jgi:hypothetical protein